MHLYYLKDQEFSRKSLSVDFKFNYAVSRSRWFYGDKIETLGGTIETVDELDGAKDLGDGLISRYGYALLDDSNTALINNERYYFNLRALCDVRENPRDENSAHITLQERDTVRRLKLQSWIIKAIASRIKRSEALSGVDFRSFR